jgi:two-component system, chemotaxis family, sensor kinase Cph1
MPAPPLDFGAARIPPDLSACEREPIHLLSAIEPNGVMLVLDESTLKILQVSSNAPQLMGFATETLLSMRLIHLFSPEAVQQLLSGIGGQGQRHYVRGLRVYQNATALDALVHRHKGLLIVEFEPASPPGSTADGPDIYASLTATMSELDGPLTLAELSQRAAMRIRKLTGFDRVMVYRFLADDSGSVIAEDRERSLPPYLGLRYPASDIPAQARRLYLLNTLRLKADVNAESAVLVPSPNPSTGQVLDMTYCVLRAMSPVHVEYLRNMGVAASMSISIVKDDRLWGLIACHHGAPKLVPHSIRVTCEVLARVFSSHIAKAEDEDGRARATAAHKLTSRIEERMRKDRDVIAALSHCGDEIATVIGAQGCAFIMSGEIVLIGTAPNRAQVEALSAWLALNQREHVFAAEEMAALYPGAAAFHKIASGLLSLRITLGGPDFVLWFRPSVVRTVTWAGNPEKPVEETDAGKRISPRRSFESWKQTFENSSEAWEGADRKFASDLRPVIAETLFLRMNEEILRLNLELARSNADLATFAYTASHDLQEPVRTIRIYAQMLSQRAGPDMDPESRKFLATIDEGTGRMSSLISALLTYSQVGGAERRRRQEVNLEETFRRVMANLNGQVRQSGAVVTQSGLPVTFTDEDHMEQLLQNLIANAIKYRGQEKPQILLSSRKENNTWHISVSDNGQGFPPEKASMIFEPFKRLHGKETPGNGIGLATCKRIVELYNGRIWAESEGPNRGATFRFTLPAAKSSAQSPA